VTVLMLLKSSGEVFRGPAIEVAVFRRTKYVDVIHVPTSPFNRVVSSLYSETKNGSYEPPKIRASTDIAY